MQPFSVLLPPSGTVHRDRSTPLAPVVLALTAVGLMTICSKSSPLYPMNDWVDANTYFTIGRGMLEGLVPFRDLIDQKGPLLYALHALAALISRDSFLGVWILEILACFGFLWFQYKTLRLFYSEAVLVLMPLLGGMLYSQRCFIHGDSAEELCLPLLAFALYAGTRAIVEDGLPDGRTFFLMGLTSGCVLWTKYTLLGFYLGWFAVPLYTALGKKQLPALLRGMGLIVAGVGVSTLPFLVYFGAYGAIGDWMQVYFYDNFVYYPRGMDGTTLDHWQRAISTGMVSLPWLGAGLVWCAGTRRWKLLWQSGLTTLLLLLGVYAGGWFIGYYRFVFSLCYLFAAALLWQVPVALWGLITPPERPTPSRKTRRKKQSNPPAQTSRWTGPLTALLAAAALALGLRWAWTHSINTYLMAYDRADLPQYRAAEVIQGSGVEDPTLLNYQFLDGGFYLASGILPTERYFCQLNARIPGMTEEVDQLLQDGAVDFVITRNRLLALPHYREVGTWSFWFEGYDWDYHLYQLVEAGQGVKNNT